MEAGKAVKTPELVKRLQALGGLEVRPDAPLAKLTTLRIGGPADLLVEISSEAALEALLREAVRESTPLWLLGQGSNVLIPDAGLRGVVLRLRGEFEEWTLHEHGQGAVVTAGAAVPLARLAQQVTRRGFLGLEALSGFPSTVGGAVYMNAGCYGTEIKDVLERARLIDRAGEWREIGVQELRPSYRATALQGSGSIVTRASFTLSQGDGEAALSRIKELNRRRWASLPSGKPNAGSVFRNPPDDFAGRLIEECGLKGETRGGAQISEKHANVIVNLESASADDVFELMVLARSRVAERFGIELEPELILTGELAPRWRGLTRAVD